MNPELESRESGNPSRDIQWDNFGWDEYVPTSSWSKNLATSFRTFGQQEPAVEVKYELNISSTSVEQPGDVKSLIQKASYADRRGQLEAKEMLLEYAETESYSDVLSTGGMHGSISWGELLQELHQLEDDFQPHYEGFSEDNVDISVLRERHLKVFLQHRLPDVEIPEATKAFY